MSRRSRVFSFILGIIMILGMLPFGAFAAGDGSFDNFSKQRSFSDTTFKDVKPGDWFYDNVKAAYELGLMVGNRSGAFDPDGDLTLAQAITVASRIHSIYSTGTDAFSRTEPWYKAYVDYAKDKGIISSDYPDYSKKATRAEFAVILSSSLPDDALAAINNVDDNAIPDVTLSETYADAVYLLYRAGIFAGNDSKGTFSPDSFIRRSEVAAVVSRMAYSSLRKSIELQATADAGFSFIPIIGSGELFGSDDSSVIDEVLRQVRIGYADGDCAECVTKDVTLPTEISVEGYKRSFSVKWYSNNQNAIQYNGQVKRGASTVDVKLTAKVTYQGKSGAKDFDLTVIKANRDVPVLCDSIDDLAQFSENGAIPRVYYNDDGFILNIDGVISNVEVFSCDDAIKALESVRNILEIGDPEAEFIGLTSNISNYVNSYVLQQVYNGIPVSYRTVTVSTTKDGVADFVNNSYLPGISISTVPGLSAEEVKDRLSKDYSGEYTYEELGLAVYTLGEHEQAPVLVYVFSACTEGYEVETLYVDASTGEVLYAESTAVYNNNQKYIFAKDELKSDRYIPVTIGHYSSNQGKDKYFLIDESRNIYVYYWNLDNNCERISYSNDGLFSGAYRADDIGLTCDYRTDISAYANVIDVYKWYCKAIGITPIIADNGEIRVIVHSTKTHDNAGYSPSTECIYFYENSVDKLPTTAGCLDIVAHEFTHGVFNKRTGCSSGKGASGAINEAYADIFGCFVEIDNINAKQIKDEEWIKDNIWISGGQLKTVFDNEKFKKISRNIANPHASYNALKLADDVIKDAYFIDFGKKEVDNGGAHQNSTIISHTAYEMYEKGIPLDILSRLWYESMVLGYNDFSTFVNVRINVLKAAQAMQLSDEHIEIIKTAFDNANIIPEYKYKIRGKITIADDDTDLTNNYPLVGASVSLKGMGFQKETTTDESGSYSFSKISGGIYTLTVSAVGYVTINQSVIVDDYSNTNCNLSIETIVEDQFGDGTASGRIIDDSTFKGVEGLTLIIRRGLNNTTKEYEDELALTTDQYGKYTTPMLRQGEYTVQIIDKREGIKDDKRFAPLSFNIKVVSNESVAVPDMRVKNTKSDELLIELSWGDVPTGLLAHMAGPTEDGGRYHFRWASSNENIDRSYRNFYITLPEEYDGLYVYAVDDWINNNKEHQTALARSGAQVKVYRGNYLLMTFNVPAKEGYLWTVFYYDGKTKNFYAINEMSNEGAAYIDKLPKTVEELHNRKNKVN